MEGIDLIYGIVSVDLLILLFIILLERIKQRIKWIMSIARLILF